MYFHMGSPFRGGGGVGGCGVGVGGGHCSDFTFSVTVIYMCIHRTETCYTDRILTVTTTVNLTALSVPRLDSGGGGFGGVTGPRCSQSPSGLLQHVGPSISLQEIFSIEVFHSHFSDTRFSQIKRGSSMFYGWNLSDIAL